MIDKMLKVNEIANVISNSCCDVTPMHNCEIPCSECLAVSIYDRVFADNTIILSQEEYDALDRKVVETKKDVIAEFACILTDYLDENIINKICKQVIESVK